MRELSVVLGTVEQETHDYGEEFPASILRWSTATFGPRDAFTIAVRTASEISELVTSICYNNDQELITEELADCGVMLWQVLEVISPMYRRSRPSNLPVESPIYEVLELQKEFTKTMQLLSPIPVNTAWNRRPGRRGTQAKLGYARNSLEKVLKHLETLALHYGVNLAEAVDNKMKINRARQWKQQSNGAYQHA